MSYHKIIKYFLIVVFNIALLTNVFAADNSNPSPNTNLHSNPKTDYKKSEPTETDKEVKQAIHRAAEIKEEMKTSSQPVLDKISDKYNNFKTKYLVPVGNAYNKVTDKIGQAVSYVTTPIKNAANTASQKMGQYVDYFKQEFGIKSEPAKDDKAKVKDEKSDQTMTEMRMDQIMKSLTGGVQTNSTTGQTNQSNATSNSSPNPSSTSNINRTTSGTYSAPTTSAPQRAQPPVNNSQQFHIIGNSPSAPRGGDDRPHGGGDDRPRPPPGGGGGPRGGDDRPHGGGGGGGPRGGDDRPHGGGGGPRED